ncbi:MAG: hypothetical protein GXP13_07385 [Gammaproteobacteria bacterium]|nr:hypothetical protein [Gammaproteobacteria bacterium]
MANLPDLSKLLVPEQKREKSWFDTRPKQIAIWVSSLPLGDPDSTTKKLFSALSHINRIHMSPSSRIKAMDALYDTFSHCVDSLKSNYVGQSFPLSSRALKYIDRSIAMYSEWAIGYKIAAINLLQHKRFYENKITVSAIYHAIDSLDKILLTHYQIYAPEPALLWSEIHALYYLAEEKGLSRQSVKSEHLKNVSKPSIESKYKESMLLSLSNPYHLGKNEIEIVHALLTEWSHSTRLLNPAEVGSGTANFVTCLNQDKAPVQLSLIKTLENNVCRFIDTSDLIQHLRFLLTQPDEEPYSSSTSSKSREYHLYKLLITAWDSREKRSFSRSPNTGDIDISIGLNSTHYLIEENKNQLEEEEAAEEVEAEEVEEEIEEKEQDHLIDDTRNPLDITHTTFSIEPIDESNNRYWKQGDNPHAQAHQPQMIRAREYSNLPDPSYSYHSWKTLNVGAGGYCLLWDHDKSSNAQIGEVVGIKEVGRNKDNIWRIGVVRWMQYLRHQGLKLGIQILSPNASTISSKLMNGRISNRKEYSCLSLPEMQSIQQPASIITPTLHYKVGDALILNDHGNMMNVQLTRLVENTGNYSRFQYSPVNQKEEIKFEQDLIDQANKWYED